MSDASLKLNELAKRFGNALKLSESDKLAMLTGVGKEVKNKVLYRSIYGSDINNPGHVRDMQKVYLGTKGGYVAVRADDSSTGANSPGAITNYLENGTLEGKRIKPRSFYEEAKLRLDDPVKKEAKEFAERLAARLRGEL